MKKIKLSASIVTYNNENEIRGVLDSLISSSISDFIEIYVVDNCSTDKTVEIINNEYDNICFIQSEKNLGFGNGHNVAIRLINTKYHFIVNPDVKFDNLLIENLVEYLEENKDVALCIPNVLDEDKKLRYPPKKNPKIRYLLGRYLESYGHIFRKWTSEYVMKDVSISEPIEIEFCSGGFMAVRTEILKKVNGFDSRFFLYFEDADITRRIRKYGKIICNPHFSIIHEGKRESHKSWKGLIMMLSSMVKYFNKWGWDF